MGREERRTGRGEGTRSLSAGLAGRGLNFAVTRLESFRAVHIAAAERMRDTLSQAETSKRVAVRSASVPRFNKSRRGGVELGLEFGFLPMTRLILALP